MYWALLRIDLGSIGFIKLTEKSCPTLRYLLNIKTSNMATSCYFGSWKLNTNFILLQVESPNLICFIQKSIFHSLGYEMHIPKSNIAKTAIWILKITYNFYYTAARITEFDFVYSVFDFRQRIYCKFRILKISQTFVLLQP